VAGTSIQYWDTGQDPNDPKPAPIKK